MDYNWGKMDAMLAKYASALTFDYHTREAYYVIEYTGERDVQELVREFDLEPVDTYLERSRRLRSESLTRFQKAKTAVRSAGSNRSIS
jgi:hypothetical protein